MTSSSHSLRSPPSSGEGGFTFIELMVTLAIMAILALVTVPLAQLDAQRRKESELRDALIQIRSAIDAYKRASDQGRVALRMGDSGYPRALDELWQGVTDQRSPTGQKIFFLRQLPRDPMTVSTDANASLTWKLRSYASPPEAPAEGSDIFDVYSASEQIGLNGIAYSRW